jgi:hypothetical protein
MAVTTVDFIAVSGAWFNHGQHWSRAMLAAGFAFFWGYQGFGVVLGLAFAPAIGGS